MPMPKTMPLNPYLTVKGAADAITFYKKALSAKEMHRLPADDGKRLMHAEIEVNGGIVMLSDEFSEFPGSKAPAAGRPSSVSIVLHFPKPEKVDAAFKQAVSAGCKAAMEPADTFWEARFAVVSDPYGHSWMLNAPLAKKKTAGGKK
jgi:PhnB protein